MNYHIRPMTLDDHEEAFRLWANVEGVDLGDDDNRDRLRIYLDRNSGLCFVAIKGEEIVGTILCGHDGRRGILRHLAVDEAHRKKGIARALVQESLAALAKEGIEKCNVFVLESNAEGLRFWQHLGFHILENNYLTLQHATGAAT